MAHSINEVQSILKGAKVPWTQSYSTGDRGIRFMLTPVAKTARGLAKAHANAARVAPTLASRATEPWSRNGSGATGRCSWA